MKKVSTAKEMQEIDKHTIFEYGVPSLKLMENAGIGAVEALIKRFNNLAAKRVLIFCGTGNNGGDGFVIARLLFNLKTDVKVLLLGKQDNIRSDASFNATSAIELGIDVVEIEKTNSHTIEHHLKNCDIVIDALFGTGLTRPASGLCKLVIEKINQAKKYTVAIDLPSGVDSDTGQFIGPHICADLTIALTLLKRSHLLYPAAEIMGEIETVDIKIPKKIIDSQHLKTYVTEETDLNLWIPKRPANSHKGTYGHVLVIAGSRGKEGAAGLTALAALRTGCGLVTLAIPESCRRSVEFQPLEAMTVTAPETDAGSFALSSKEILLRHCKEKSAVAIGPGLSTDPETMRLLSELLPAIQCPLVVDADGINSLANNPSLILKLGQNTVLTPHPKEMSRLLGIDISKILKNRIEVATKFASDYSVNIVLKGAASIIAQPNGLTMINPTGNSGMATAGSGDVLTGIIVSLIAQGLPSSKAAITGVYLHGLAGDIFAEAESEASLIAGDLLRMLPESMKRILN